MIRRTSTELRLASFQLFRADLPLISRMNELNRGTVAEGYNTSGTLRLTIPWSRFGFCPIGPIGSPKQEQVFNRTGARQCVVFLSPRVSTALSQCL